MLYFVTGSTGKFKEISAIIPDIKQLEMDLDEIQSLDPKPIIEHKLTQAATHHQGEFIVEDTMLSIHCLHGLPGTLVKWFIEAMGIEGIAALAMKHEDRSALARTTIGYRDAAGEAHYFTGTVAGTIVPPRGGGFGWDAIFVPEGYNQTFGELGPEVKNKISMRANAARKLAAHLAKS